MPGGAYSNLKLFAGTSHRELAELISHRLSIPLSPSDCVKRSSGEIMLDLKESVREADVYIINTASAEGAPTNVSLMETLIMAHACKIASAKRITVVMPHFPYARQDKKDKSRAPITAKLVANMLVSSGVNHVITMDLHASQIQGFFDVPVDKCALTCCFWRASRELTHRTLYAEPTMVQYLRETVDVANAVIVSPDAGGAKRASSLAARLDLDFALFHKERKKANEVSRMVLVGEVKGKLAILIDDMADTCGTLAMASNQLKEAGATDVIALVTHGILSGSAFTKLEDSALSALVVTNTIPQSGHAKRSDKVHILDISSVLAETIRRSYYGESISYLFDAVPYTQAVRLDYADHDNDDAPNSPQPRTPNGVS